MPSRFGAAPKNRAHLPGSLLLEFLADVRVGIQRKPNIRVSKNFHDDARLDALRQQE